MSEARKLPKQARSAAMVEAILEAAARILEEGGLADLNTNRIAERAGVSVGSLYQYFPAKDAIVAELIRREHADLLAALQATAARTEGAPIGTAVRALVRVGVQQQMRRPALSRALDYLEPLLSPQAEGEAVDAAIRALITAVLRSGAPRLRGRALATAAADLAALSRGMIDAAGRRGDTAGNALVERATRAVLGYLSPWLPPAGRGNPARV